MLIDLRPRIQKPPFGSVQVDWGHPLANGLQECLIFNEGSARALDYGRTSNPVKSVFNAPLSQVTPDGLALSFNGSNQSVWLTRGSTVSVNYSIVLRFLTTTASQVVAAFGVIDDGVTSGIAVEWNSDESEVGAANKTRFFLRDASANAYSVAFTNSTVYDGKAHTLVFVRTGTTISAVYLDGASQSLTIGSTGLTATAWTPVEPMALGGRNLRGTTDEQSATKISGFSQYAIALTQPMALWLSKEPYAFFRPVPGVRYWSPPPAAAAAGSVVTPRSLALLGVGA